MKFNETFEEYMSLYTEAKKGLTGLALLAQQEQGEKVGKDGKGLGPDSKEEEKEEDNETAKKVAKKAIKGTAKLAGKSAIAFGDYMTGGDVSKGIDFVKSSYEDCESCGCSDEEVEDCETCGCEENPEYGHFDDTYSSYIDQYEAEDGERVDKDRMK